MHNFNLLILYIFILALLPLRPCYASECINTIKTEPKSVLDELATETEKYRKQKIIPSGGEITVRGKKYFITAELGKRSSVAYLVKDENNNLFVLKIIKGDDTSPDWAFSANYEAVATQFYTEMGFLLPKVIAFQYSRQIGKHTQAMIIKEYRPGVTAEELNSLQYSSKYFWVQTSQKKLKELPLIIENLKEAHQHFKNWLVKKNINLHERNFEKLNSLIENGDIYPDNLLLDAQTGQWILFDP